MLRWKWSRGEITVLSVAGINVLYSCWTAWGLPIYLLDWHPGHRFQGTVASRREVVSVSLHLDGFQPLSHWAEGGEVWCALIQQWTNWSAGWVQNGVYVSRGKETVPLETQSSRETRQRDDQRHPAGRQIAKRGRTTNWLEASINKNIHKDMQRVSLLLKTYFWGQYLLNRIIFPVFNKALFKQL